MEEFYYYKLNKNNEKYYFSSITDKRISKFEISSDVINLVTEKNPKIIRYENILEIIDERNNLQKKIDDLQIKISSFNTDLSNIGISNLKEEFLVKSLLQDYYDKLNIKIMNGDKNDPDLYYCTKYSSGCTYYYSLVTNKRISKSDIPIDIISLIKQKDPKIQAVDIINKKDDLGKKLLDLNNKKLLLESKLSDVGINNYHDENNIHKFLNDYKSSLSNKYKEFIRNRNNTNNTNNTNNNNQ